MTNDKSRIEDSRAVETRDANIRKHLRMEYQDPLYIAPEDIPPDVEYRNINVSVLGMPVPHRLAQMHQKGWELVPSTRHPEKMHNYDTDTVPSHLRGYIYHRGQVLCERLKKYCDIERDNVNKENYRTITGTPGTDHLMSDPMMPMKVYFNENSILKTERKGSFADD